MEENNQTSNNPTPIALLITDCHCGKETVGDFLINWDEAIELCLSQNIKTILFLGDLVLSRSAQSLDILLAIHDVLEKCRKYGIQVVMINGNHCKVNQEALRGYCNVFDSFENVRVISEWGEVRLSENLGIGMISYFPENGSFIKKLEELETYLLALPYSKKILMIHEGIRGGLSRSTDDELPANMFSSWDKVSVGHYHNRNKVDNNIFYIGSSRQGNFGEDEEKGYTLLYADGSTRFIKNQVNIRYQVIDIPIEKADIHLSDRLEEIREDGRYRVKVRVHSTAAKASGLDKEKLISAGANKIEMVTEDLDVMKTTETSLFEKFDNQKIKDNYGIFCQEKEVEDMEFGLAYLSKIN